MSAWDDFVEQYYKGLGDLIYANPMPISAEDTALIVIDAQTMISREFLAAQFEHNGSDMAIVNPLLDEYEARLNQTLGNIEQVLAACRAKGIRPIHTRIQAMLLDASDTGHLHKLVGFICPPGGVGTEFFPQAMPLDDEIVLPKTCSGMVHGTSIDRVLRNLGIKHLIVIGFYTDQCISNAVRDFSDLGYDIAIIEDAINAMSRDRHEKAMQSLSKIYANSETTKDFLARIDQIG